MSDNYRLLLAQVARQEYTQNIAEDLGQVWYAVKDSPGQGPQDHSRN